MEDSKKISILKVDDRSRFYISKGKLIFLNNQSYKYSLYGLIPAILSMLCSTILLWFFIELVGFSDIIIPISIIIAILINIIYFIIKITLRNIKLTFTIIMQIIIAPSVAMFLFILYILTLFGFSIDLFILILNWFLIVFVLIYWITMSIYGIIASFFYKNYKIIWEYNTNINKIILIIEILRLKKKKEFEISKLDSLKVIEKIKADYPFPTYTFLLENIFVNGKKYIIFTTDVNFEAYNVMEQINIFLGRGINDDK